MAIRATKVEGQPRLWPSGSSSGSATTGPLSTQQAAAAIRHQLNTTAKPLWATGHVSVGDLWKLYAAYAYMPRLRDRAALNAGLRNAPLLWEQDWFALAEGTTSRLDATAGSCSHRTRRASRSRTRRLSSSRLSRSSGGPGRRPPRRQRRVVRHGLHPGRHQPARRPPRRPPKPGKTRFFGTKELSPGPLRQELQEDHRRSPHPPGRHPGVDLRSPSRSKQPPRPGSTTTGSAPFPRTPEPSSSNSPASKKPELQRSPVFRRLDQFPLARSQPEPFVRRKADQRHRLGSEGRAAILRILRLRPLPT